VAVAQLLIVRPMMHATVGEELVQLTAVFVENKGLRRWFVALQRLPISERDARLTELVARMKARGEKQPVISAVAALRHPEIYAAVQQTLRDSRRADLLSMRRAAVLLVIIALVGVLGVWLLKRSFADDQIAETRYFWPAIICLLTAFGLLAFATGRGFLRMVRASRDAL